MTAFRFYLGTHQTDWLEKSEVPLFVSAIRLRLRKGELKPSCDWALDSGGFTELSTHGRWTVTPEQYVNEVHRWRQWGNLRWAAIQDWMCEDVIIHGNGKIPGTKLSIPEHQRRTVENYDTLLQLDPSIPWCPVLQGFTLDDYLRCLDLYQKKHDLFKLPVVGIGTLCRRQGTKEAEKIVKHFSFLGLKIHAFGFKLKGLQNVWSDCVSSDSLAWSFAARKRPAMAGHTHKNCANCQEYAVRWRVKLLDSLQ